MAEYKSKVLIIGSGPAGYTAGIYAARAGLKPVLVSGTQVGGQLTITTEVENFPGFPEPIQGGELMQRMRDQAQNVGVQMIDDTITEIDFEHRPFVCSSENANSFVGDSLIIATGASARWLGLPSEEKKIPRLWRLGLRDLRRLFLPQPQRRRCRRRQFRTGRGALSDQFCQKRHDYPPP